MLDKETCKKCRNDYYLKMGKDGIIGLWGDFHEDWFNNGTPYWPIPPYVVCPPGIFIDYDNFLILKIEKSNILNNDELKRLKEIILLKKDEPCDIVCVDNRYIKNSFIHITKNPPYWCPYKDKHILENGE